MDLDILVGFQEEANQILEELSGIIERLEVPQSEFPSALLSEFSQKIDRIMGAAKTLAVEDPLHLGLKRVSQISEICKSLGYRAAEVKELILIPVFCAFWADALEVIGQLMKAMEDEGASAKIAGDFSTVLQKRLQWLLDKVDQAAAQKGMKATVANLDIEDLLKTFG